MIFNFDDWYQPDSLQMSKLLLKLRDAKDVRAALRVRLLHPLLLLLHVLVQLLQQWGKLEVAGDVVLCMRPDRDQIKFTSSTIPF